jgi:hypothetical protein
MQRVVKCDDGRWWIIDWTDMWPVAGPFASKDEADAIPLPAPRIPSASHASTRSDADSLPTLG